MEDAALEARTYKQEDDESARSNGKGERLRLCYTSIGFGAVRFFLFFCDFQ